tara:strand:- start:1031 stop:1765 length:735 start_codon:yes stop_codon:yes gene_type:complete
VALAYLARLTHEKKHVSKKKGTQEMSENNEVAFGLDGEQSNQAKDTESLAAGMYASSPSASAESAVADTEPALVQDPGPDQEDRSVGLGSASVNMDPTREAALRSKNERPKDWAPPAMLDAPHPPMGYQHRWIRYESRGIVDNSNIMARFREGYEPVVRLDYPDWECPTINDGRHAGTFTTGGLILCRVPVEIVKQRNKYYEARTVDADRAVDNDILKENTSIMPFDPSQRQTKVTFGRGRSQA